MGALSQVKELADVLRAAPGDYGDVARALKKVVTKAGAYTSPLFRSTGALSVGQRLHLGVV